jgi:hypothetical protein
MPFIGESEFRKRVDGFAVHMEGEFFVVSIEKMNRSARHSATSFRKKKKKLMSYWETTTMQQYDGRH